MVGNGTYGQVHKVSESVHDVMAVGAGSWVEPCPASASGGVWSNLVYVCAESLSTKFCVKCACCVCDVFA